MRTKPLGTAGWMLQEAHLLPLHQDLLERLQVSAHTHLLDVACGAGGFARLAAGRGAEVTGVDDAVVPLVLARERVREGEFLPADPEQLPFSAQRFDAVVGIDVFQYAAHPVRALAQARRVTSPGAPIVVGAWAAREDTPEAACRRALAPLLPTAAGDADPPRDDAGHEALALRAGLAPLVIAEVDCPWRYADLDGVLRVALCLRPAQAAVRAVGERTARAALEHALSPWRSRDGSYQLPNPLHYLIASA